MVSATSLWYVFPCDADDVGAIKKMHECTLPPLVVHATIYHARGEHSLSHAVYLEHYHGDDRGASRSSFETHAQPRAYARQLKNPGQE